VTAALYLASAHIRYHAGRSAILVLVLAILGAIPLLTGRLATLAETELLERAASTPLVYGPPRSTLDLSLSALFFEGEPRAELSMSDYEALAEMRLGLALPILRTHTARGFPVVGIDVEYLAFRALTIDRGRPMVRLGEAVIGAEVAERLGLGPGGRIQSDSGQIFELAGAYPVRMPVTGVLSRSGTADDRAVFVDLATAWIVAGLGHGHENLATTDDESIVLAREADRIVANAKLTEHIEISPQSEDDFHLHGDPSQAPLSAVLVAPRDERAAAILRGRVEDGGPGRQVFRPLGVIRGLLDDVFRVKSVLDFLVAAVTVAALLALGMMIALSLKLRRREFEVARQLGADRGAMVRLVVAELALLLAGSTALSALALAVVAYHGAALVRALVFGA
jgi:putative ABC transport system permease protein